MAVSGNDIPRVETITVEPQADMITVEPQEETATIDTDLAEYHADQEREHHTRFERLIGLAQYRVVQVRCPKYARRIFMKMMVLPHNRSNESPCDYGAPGYCISRT